MEKSELKVALEKRFGEHRVQEMQSGREEYSLLLLDLELRSPVTVLMTNGLSSFKMNVPEKYSGREYCEIYFCLPNYWEWEDALNPRMNWPFEWIKKLANHMIDKETWYGHGHTFPVGKEGQPLSESMKQDFLILLDPILLNNELAPLILGKKTIHFLSITPLFKKEFEYKQARGTFKLLQKFNMKGITENLDDFRGSVLQSKWTLRRN